MFRTVFFCTLVAINHCVSYKAHITIIGNVCLIIIKILNYFDLLKFFLILMSSQKNLQAVKLPSNLEVILSE